MFLKYLNHVCQCTSFLQAACTFINEFCQSLKNKSLCAEELQKPHKCCSCRLHRRQWCVVTAGFKFKTTESISSRFKTVDATRSKEHRRRSKSESDIRSLFEKLKDGKKNRGEHLLWMLQVINSEKYTQIFFKNGCWFPFNATRVLVRYSGCKCRNSVLKASLYFQAKKMGLRPHANLLQRLQPRCPPIR